MITRLNTQLQRVLQRYDVKERCASLGVEAKSSSAAAFSAQIKSEFTRYVRLIKDSGITPEQGCAGRRAPRLPEDRHNSPAVLHTCAPAPTVPGGFIAAPATLCWRMEMIMDSRTAPLGFEGIRNLHRGVTAITAITQHPRHRKWVFAGMLAAAAGMLVWRCVVGGTSRRS